MDYIKIGLKGSMNWKLMYITHLLCITKVLRGDVTVLTSLQWDNKFMSRKKLFLKEMVIKVTYFYQSGLIATAVITVEPTFQWCYF